jgi:hypothetical protein
MCQNSHSNETLTQAKIQLKFQPNFGTFSAAIHNKKDEKWEDFSFPFGKRRLPSTFQYHPTLDEFSIRESVQPWPMAGHLGLCLTTYQALPWGVRAKITFIYEHFWMSALKRYIVHSPQMFMVISYLLSI